MTDKEKMRAEFESAMLERMKTVAPEYDFVDQASAWVASISKESRDDK